MCKLKCSIFAISIMTLLLTQIGAGIAKNADPATDNVWPDKTETPKAILDVDMSTDVDDLSAIRIMENLNSCGAQRLMAVVTSVTDGSDAVAGLLSADGYYQIPVGISSVNNPDPGSPYWDYLKGESSANQQMDAVKLYRKILAESDTRVSIVTTGFLTNIEALIKSSPDEYSSLTGSQLIAYKVRAIHITGGSFPDGFDNNFGAYDRTAEAADYCFSNWPKEVPIILYTNNLGAKIQTGLFLSNTDPLKECFALAGKENGSTGWDAFNTWAFECIDSGSETENELGIEACNIRIRQGTRENVFEQYDDKNVYRVTKLNQDQNYYQSRVSLYELR